MTSRSPSRPSPGLRELALQIGDLPLKVGALPLALGRCALVRLSHGALHGPLLVVAQLFQVGRRLLAHLLRALLHKPELALLLLAQRLHLGLGALQRRARLAELAGHACAQVGLLARRAGLRGRRHRVAAAMTSRRG